MINVFMNLTKAKRIRITCSLLSQIFIVIILVLSSFLINEIRIQKVNATCYSCCVCSTCCGSDGCRQSTACKKSEFAATCGSLQMCCDKGDCNICTPTCGTGYQSSNNGCSTAQFTCHDTYCYGGSCGQQRSTTCYRIKYTVTIDGQGGSCSPTPQTPCGSTASTAPTCSRTGYTLSNYSLEPGSTCGGTFNSSTGVCSSVTSNIEINANWKAYVTVDGNGGSCSPGSHYVPVGSSSSSQTCTRTGYTFNGFTLEAGACGGTLNYTTGVCSSVTQAFTIKAQWKAYVTVDGNGGTCSPGSHYVDYGSASSSQTCTRTGYTFSSFTITSGSCLGFNTSTGVCPSVRAPITIQANWSINYYTVSAQGNGGTCDPASQSVPYGSASGTVTCLRTGYNFTGFTSPNPTSGCGGTFNSTTGVCSSVVGTFSITAQWVVANQAPTTPTTPYCIGTTNPTNVTTQTPYFSAIFNDPDTGNTGNYYEIEVNTNNSFTGTVMWDSGSQSMTATNNGVRSPNIYYNGSSLGWSGTTYYWRIRFWDNGGLVSPWSAVQNFTMHSNSAPTAPTSLQTESATNPIQVTDTTPEFRAIFNDPNTGDTGIQYEIEVNTASDFTGTVKWDSGLQSMTSTPIGSYSPQISYSGTTLTLNGATYYWRIRFVDNYGYVGAWSATANFKMNNIPTATNPKTNGQTNPPKVPMTPYFTAVFNDADTSATGTYYEVEVNTASNFAGIVMWDSGQTAHSPAISNGGTSSNITYGGSAFSSGVLYYWRIRFWDNAGTPSNWSTTSNFRTTTPPSSPTGLLVDGQTNPTGLSTFTPPFSAIHNDLNDDSATYYEIEVNSSSAFDGTVMWDTGKTSTSVNNGSRSPDYIYAGTPLTGSGTTYYWRIRFWDVDDNTGAWSATATFRDSLAHFYLNGLQMNGIRLD